VFTHAGVARGLKNDLITEVCCNMELHCRAIYGEALQLTAEQMALPEFVAIL
jgi:hypothetical protein